MIVVEGADCVGKTTLCQMLWEMEMSLHWKHYGLLPNDHDRYFDYFQDFDYFNLLDRFYMSEIVYRKAANEPCKLNANNYRMLDKMLIEHIGIVIVMTADEETIRENYRLRGDDMYKLDRILHVNNLFYELVTKGVFYGYEPYTTFHVHNYQCDPTAILSWHVNLSIRETHAFIQRPSNRIGIPKPFRNFGHISASTTIQKSQHVC